MTTAMIPLRYLPRSLTKRDKKKQLGMLQKSRKLYKKNKYFTREKVPSYKKKTSIHVLNAEKIYGIKSIQPDKQLALKTGCKLTALKQIVAKGQGAYFSSGSRPNQTAHSWGMARLASSITGGKAAAVDFHILDEGCDHKKKAYRLAKEAREKYHFGQSKTRKIKVAY
jgi:hypothetical protein